MSFLNTVNYIKITSDCRKHLGKLSVQKENALGEEYGKVWLLSDPSAFRGHII